MISHLHELLNSGDKEKLLKAMKDAYCIAKEQSIKLPEVVKITDDNRWQNELKICENCMWDNFLSPKPQVFFVLNTIDLVKRIFMQRGIKPQSAENTGKYHAIEVLDQFACFAEIAF